MSIFEYNVHGALSVLLPLTCNSTNVAKCVRATSCPTYFSRPSRSRMPGLSAGQLQLLARFGRTAPQWFRLNSWRGRAEADPAGRESDGPGLRELVVAGVPNRSRSSRMSSSSPGESSQLSQRALPSNGEPGNVAPIRRSRDQKRCRRSAVTQSGQRVLRTRVTAALSVSSTAFVIEAVHGELRARSGSAGSASARCGHRGGVECHPHRCDLRTRCRDRHLPQSVKELLEAGGCALVHRFFPNRWATSLSHSQSGRRDPEARRQV